GGPRMRLGDSTLDVPLRLPADVATLGFRAEQARIGEPGPGEIALTLRGCETPAGGQVGASAVRPAGAAGARRRAAARRRPAPRDRSGGAALLRCARTGCRGRDAASVV